MSSLKTKLLPWPKADPEPARGPLPSRVLVLAVVFMLAIAVALGIIVDLSSRRQAEDLVTQRGDTVLDGISEQLRERQRSKEIFAQLLANESGLAEALEQDDKVGLSQVVVPLKSTLGLGFVDIHNEDGREVLNVGPNEEAIQEPLLAPALAGLTESTVGVSDDGIEVSGAAPVKSSTGIVGAMVVGTTLGGEALGEVTGRGDVELAVYRDGRLVTSTVEQPDLARLLGEYGVMSEDLQQLNSNLERFNFRAVAEPLSGGQLVALVPTEDLVTVSEQHNWLLLAAFLVLIGVLVVVGLLAWRFERSKRFVELLRIHNLQERTTRLQQSNRELQDFVRIASHDLQEPLRKIRAFSDRLETKYADSMGEQGRDYLGRIEGAAERMQNLMDELLALSRLNTRARPFEPVVLNEVVKEVVSDLEARVEETGGQVEVSDLPVIEADDSQIRQLFQNLIGNALKFHKTGEEPHVRVRGELLEGREDKLENGWHAHGRFCRIEVEDDGIGFDEKYLEQIFAPFQRLHGRGDYEGTGMGLTICQKVVERHSGEITAKSVPGHGARFIITLPVEQSEAGQGSPRRGTPVLYKEEERTEEEKRT